MINSFNLDCAWSWDININSKSQFVNLHIAAYGADTFCDIDRSLYEDWGVGDLENTKHATSSNIWRFPLDWVDFSCW
jgi:hypothetical protein